MRFDQNASLNYPQLIIRNYKNLTSKVRSTQSHLKKIAREERENGSRVVFKYKMLIIDGTHGNGMTEKER